MQEVTTRPPEDAPPWTPPPAPRLPLPGVLPSALRITLAYAAFAATWIYLSDHWVSEIAASAEETLSLSVWKGAAFVGVTAVLLFALMVSVFGRLEAANRLQAAHKAEVARFNRLYSALSEVNQASLWSTSRDTLFQQVCQALVEHGGAQDGLDRPGFRPARQAHPGGVVRR